MQIIFKYIRSFTQREFNVGYLLCVLTLVGIMIYLNYAHGLEKRWVGNAKGWPAKFLGSFLIYFIPFATAFLLQPLFYKNTHYFQQSWFWAILIIAPLLFAFRVHFTWHQSFFKPLLHAADAKWGMHAINWVVRALLVILPIALIWFIKDKNTQPFYGVKSLETAMPYVWMVAIMIPLLWLASQQKDFGQVYPKARMLAAAGPQPWYKYLLFELSYGFDFISIELFFRGFLVLSLLQICGTQCILPIACFY